MKQAAGTTPSTALRLIKVLCGEHYVPVYMYIYNCIYVDVDIKLHVILYKCMYMYI